MVWAPSGSCVRLAEFPRVFHPGEGWRYRHSFGPLSILLARVTGRPLEEHLAASPWAGRLGPLAFGVPCVIAVIVCGELSTGALIAVGTTGAVLAGVGLARRAGEAAPPVGRRGWPWLVWIAAAGTWEALTLVDDGLPTLSDLLDPILAHPALRGAATICWLMVGAWLLARPCHRDKSW